MRIINCVVCGDDCTESYYDACGFAICDDCYKGKPKKKKLILEPRNEIVIQEFKGA